MRGHGKLSSKTATPCITVLPLGALCIICERLPQGTTPRADQCRYGQATFPQKTNRPAKPLRRHIHEGGGRRTRLSALAVRAMQTFESGSRSTKSLSAELAPEWREFDSACAAKVCSPFHPPNLHLTRRNISTGAGRETGAVVFMRRSPLFVRSLSEPFFNTPDVLARFLALLAVSTWPALGDIGAAAYTGDRTRAHL
jgi:hypothetical protein